MANPSLKPVKLSHHQFSMVCEGLISLEREMIAKGAATNLSHMKDYFALRAANAKETRIFISKVVYNED
jgi:hypothetical protein